MLLFLLFGALCSAGCWGCHGDLLADRPGSERLPQFLFFTGIAASLLAAFAVQLCAAFPLWAAYAFVVLLALAARFLPREHGDKRIAVESEGDLAGEAAPHAETSTGVFEKDRRVRGSGSGGP